MTENAVVAPKEVVAVSRLQQAYQRHYEKLMGLKPEELVTINIDVPSVYTLGIGTLGKLQAYREQILGLPGIDRTLVEQSDDYLLALGHAQALYLAATAPVASIPELYAQLLKRREVLLADAQALSVRGLLSADKLHELKGPISHAATAFDVLALCSILRVNWDSIQGKTGLQLNEIEQAELQADRLLVAVGERAVSDETASIATRTRQAAFSLFVRSYDELRRGMVYLRWNAGDADELAPSLYSSRVGRRRKPEEKPAPAAEAKPSEGKPAEAKPTPASSATAPKPVVGAPDPNAPVGHPDNPPFVSA